MKILMKKFFMVKILFGMLPLGLAFQAKTPRLPENHLPVPIVRQATEYSCGAASLLAVLRYWGLCDDAEMELHSGLKTSKTDGTSPEAILTLAKQYKLSSSIEQDVSFERLESALRDGVTVIIDFQAWKENDPISYSQAWEHGHYAVVIGMDENHVYLMDPAVGTNYTYLSREDLDARWRDYEVVDGKRVEYQRMAIFLKGRSGMKSFPGILAPTY